MAAEKSDFNIQDLGSFSDPLAPYLSYPELSQTTARLPNNKRYYLPADSNKGQENPSGFPQPIVNRPNADQSTVSGFDAHICYDSGNPLSLTYARRLHSAVRYAFPQLRVYSMFDTPAGPFTTGSFEVALFSPADFAEFVPWLLLWHGPLSAIIHTNTTVDGRDHEENRTVNDHTTRAMWIGERIPLALERLGSGPGPRKGSQGIGAVKAENKKKLCVEVSTTGAGLNGILSPKMSSAWWERRAMWER